jgi:hypothetical protein
MERRKGIKEYIFVLLARTNCSLKWLIVLLRSVRYSINGRFLKQLV